MRKSRWISLVLAAAVVAVGLSGSVFAQNKKSKPPKPAPDPAFAPVADDPSLPRVLLIGDSISIGYTVAVRDALKGKANVHRAPTNCGPTIRGMEQLDQWLGKGRWDVIHFNFGLHDLKQINGKQQVPLDQYDKNLRDLVGRLKKTGAALVWCSTTPVPQTSSPPRSNEDVLKYNAAAKKIMDETGVPIDDLYAFALPQIGKIQRPSNVHFTTEGSAILAKQVAASITEQLEKRAKGK
jgi:acyl-CoA thioesterase-1